MEVTLQQILDEFRSFVDKHYNLYTFGFGAVNEINPKEIEAPLLWITPGGDERVSNNSVINGNQMLLSFNMLILDLQKQDKSNLETIMSNMLLVGNDAIRNFWQTGEMGTGVDKRYDLWSIVNNGVQFEPVFFEFSHALTGWRFTFDIEIQNNGGCEIPMA